MGRVAKYKKVKSFDPYSKKNKGNIDLTSVGVWGLGDNGRKAKKRSLKAKKLHAKKNLNRKKSAGFDDGGFDVPPTEGDEFDMADLVGSIKKKNDESKELLGGQLSSSAATKAVSSSSSSDANTETDASTNKDDNNKKSKDEPYDQVLTSTGNIANIPRTDEDEKKVERMLRVDEQIKQKSEKEKQLNHGRMEGESKRAYAKRTRAETRQIIKQSATTPKNYEKLQKKKEFLKAKKKSKKRKGGAYSFDGYGDSNGAAYDDDDVKGNANQQSEAPVRFGEQAERPPVFRQIPRGAKAKKPNTITISKGKTQGMTEHQVEAEKDAMELMRRRVQAQYKAIKSKRKSAGDFHL
mmetsp:Transcript_13648/g.28614  ORF Transcript_13648/g.28614 Transcript_13648/m.28614 type:complete len:351 (+) Transcript_13648:190-1242(+)|eukprot:CAMPEP_0168199450 /NCGR_PEP_ID=MMETSP0139_2-20121125/22426_1 /TAXON_ID=44445 /ORGANISM="Pseudo-nitzschia australis, Strain 10249 10 AB" /LENGTH=350 /DNA_ID=CAMNT_0008124433 /DNA_START=137 /DNA_END=1189 /DNA_ORIENTATION=+